MVTRCTLSALDWSYAVLYLRVCGVLVKTCWTYKIITGSYSMVARSVSTLIASPTRRSLAETYEPATSFTE